MTTDDVKPFLGEISDWRVYEWPLGYSTSFVVIGIHLEREIRTSWLVSIKNIGGSLILETKNSLYRLVNPGK
jgi:hypothetical protein